MIVSTLLDLYHLRLPITAVVRVKIIYIKVYVIPNKNSQESFFNLMICSRLNSKNNVIILKEMTSFSNLEKIENEKDSKKNITAITQNYTDC